MTLTVRPFAAEDAALYADWTAQPHVQGWWEGEDRTIPPTDAIRLMVLDEEGRAFAHAQLYPSPYEVGAQQVDFFIGETSHLGKLYGSRILSAVVVWAREQGIDVLTIDPALDNAKARECYAKAGFEEVAERERRIVMRYASSTQ